MITNITGLKMDLANLEPYIFDKNLMDLWLKERELNYAIPDPGDNLIEIYEIDTFKDALLLRAEKWDSLEQLEHSYEADKKPLNIQNPNYTTLLELIRGLQKQSDDLKKTKKEFKEKTFEAFGAFGTFEDNNKKLNKTWQTLLIYVKTISNCTVIKIYRLESLPDIRLLRFMLSKRQPIIDVEIISLICSYLYHKYML